VNDTSNPTSCDLRCPLKTQYFDDKTMFGCVDCPTGFTVDAYNNCTVPVPTSPPPTCGPGFYMNTTTKKCTTDCPYWRYNDPTNPKNCLPMCPSSTQRYDNQYNFGCESCPTGYGVDNNNECTILLPTPPPPPPPPSINIALNQSADLNNASSSNSSSNASSNSSSQANPVVNNTNNNTITNSPGSSGGKSSGGGGGGSSCNPRECGMGKCPLIDDSNACCFGLYKPC
jgi:hypothetical protein